MKEEDIVLVGLSLGTAVVAQLAAELQNEGKHSYPCSSAVATVLKQLPEIQPRGVVMLAPFTSIKDLLVTYSLFGVIPILQPLQMFPPLQS